jgi:splicing factor 3B subunit 2
MPAPVANGSTATANGRVNGKPNGAGKSAPKSRGALKRLKQKAKKSQAGESASEAGTESERESDVEVSETAPTLSHRSRQSVASTASISSVDTLEIDVNDPTYQQFQSVFASFQEREGDGIAPVDEGPNKGEVYYSDEEDQDEESHARAKKAWEQEGMTRRERRAAAVGTCFSNPS